MSAPAKGRASLSGGQILRTARATMGRFGICGLRTGAAGAASMAIGCARAAGAKAVKATVGATVLEPASSAQHIEEMVTPSDAQQSSAAISEQTRHGHRARTRLNTATAHRP